MAHIKHHENLYNASNLHWFIVLDTVQKFVNTMGIVPNFCTKTVSKKKKKNPSFP